MENNKWKIGIAVNDNEGLTYEITAAELWQLLSKVDEVKE